MNDALNSPGVVNAINSELSDLDEYRAGPVEFAAVWIALTVGSLALVVGAMLGLHRLILAGLGALS